MIRLQQFYEAADRRKKPPAGPGMSQRKLRQLKIRTHAYLTEMDLR